VDTKWKVYFIHCTRIVSVSRSRFDQQPLKAESSCPSNYHLLRFGPRRWRELSDLGDLGRWQAREQILQVIKWVDLVPTATSQQGVNHCATFPRFRMPDEQKILFFMKSFP